MNRSYSFATCKNGVTAKKPSQQQLRLKRKMDIIRLNTFSCTVGYKMDTLVPNAIHFLTAPSLFLCIHYKAKENVRKAMAK